MAVKKQILKCEVCGNIVEVVDAGAGTLVCCNKQMTALEENSTDAAQEKHVPVVNVKNDTVEVTVGSTVHPMDDKHYIQWIELVSDNLIIRKHLTPRDEPKAVFNTIPDKFYVRELCNLHGLWRGK